MISKDRKRFSAGSDLDRRRRCELSLREHGCDTLPATADCPLHRSRTESPLPAARSSRCLWRIDLCATHSRSCSSSLLQSQGISCQRRRSSQDLVFFSLRLLHPARVAQRVAALLLLSPRLARLSLRSRAPSPPESRLSLSCPVPPVPLLFQHSFSYVNVICCHCYCDSETSHPGVGRQQVRSHGSALSETPACQDGCHRCSCRDHCSMSRLPRPALSCSLRTCQTGRVHVCRRGFPTDILRRGCG